MAELSPLQIQIEAFLRGIGRVEDVVATAWPGERLDWFQSDLIGKILLGLNGKYKELFVKGCTGAGKGASVAMAANLWFETPGSQIVCNSASFKHAKEVMFAEICKWRSIMQFATPCEILDAKIRGTTQQHYIVVVNPDTGESISGRHGTKVLFIFDEASAASAHFYHLAQTQAHMIVALSNPRVLSGWFRRAFNHPDPDIAAADVTTPGGNLRRIITVSGESCWNVRTGSEVLKGQITRSLLAEIMANPDANHRRVYGQGRFPTEDTETQLILPSWLMRHVEAWHQAKKTGFVIPVTAVGFDIADSVHGDWTCLAGGSEQGCREILKRRKSDTMQTVGWAINRAKERWRVDLCDGTIPVVVDADGLGVGAADRLSELGAWVVHHRGNQTAENPRNYGNMRAETFGLLSVRLDPQEFETPWPLPHSDTLLDDLAAPEKIIDSDGVRFKLQPKRSAAGAKPPKNHRGDVVQSIYDKLGRSPDEGDAVAMLWRGVHTLASGEPVESQFVKDNEVLCWTPDMEKQVDDARKSAKISHRTVDIAGKESLPRDEVQAYLDSILAFADEEEEAADERKHDKFI